MNPTSYPAATPTGHVFLEGYSICDHCNFTDTDLEVLLNSGTCTPSDFSSYMPLIYQMYACIFVIALLGNTLVLYTVAANRKMHTVTNLFIANLAVGDLLIMVFCVPFSVASIIVLQYWPFGEVLCVFVNYSQAVSIFVSAYTLVAISLDRYLAIIYPLRPRMTRCQAKVIIAAVWFMALVTTLPIAVFSRLDPTDLRVYQWYGREVCREDWPNEMLRKYYTMSLMILQYFLPLLVLIYTYSRIACKVWGCRSTRFSHSGCNTQMTLVAAPETARGLLRTNASDHSPAKMIRMTLAVVLVYSLCWLPFNILMVILDFVEEAGFWTHTHHVWFICHWLAMSHACYNPLILCWMNTKFREGYLLALYRLLPCCRSRLSHSLLQLRQSAGLQRAYTSSTRASRTQRYSAVYLECQVRENNGDLPPTVPIHHQLDLPDPLHHHHLHHLHHKPPPPQPPPPPHKPWESKL
ncbi:RYamide receptor-like [Portunus trituberculatus]|nr:RYamide receptor-like [Portunus trituberculatus]